MLLIIHLLQYKSHFIVNRKEKNQGLTAERRNSKSVKLENRVLIFGGMQNTTDYLTSLIGVVFREVFMLLEICGDGLF